MSFAKIIFIVERTLYISKDINVSRQRDLGACARLKTLKLTP